MESSSDSFAWTDASSDSIDSGVMAVNNINKGESDKESESGKKYKEKLQKQLFADHETKQEIQRKDRKRKLEKEQTDTKNIDVSNKNMIKSEPETDDGDVGVPKKKRKTKHADVRINGLHDKSPNNDIYDESYLNIRVKEEQALAAPSPVKCKNRSQSPDGAECNPSNIPANKKLKKNKKESINNQLNNTVDNYRGGITFQNDDAEETNIGSGKKKKKKSKKSGKDTSITDDIIIEDKFCAEETVVETQHKDSEIDQKYIYDSNKEMPSEDSDHDENSVIPRDSRNSVDGKSLDHSVSNDLTTPHKTSLDNSKTLNSLNIPEKMNHRSPKLSDRIIFEDEDSDIETGKDHSTKNMRQSSKLKHFLKANANLKPLSHILSSESALTSDDDIWVFKCPNEIDINAFKNKCVVLDKKCKIKIDSQTYEGSMVEGNGKVTILSSDHSKLTIKNVSVKSTIQLRKRIPKAHLQEDNIMVNNQTNFIPLPETKCRHPLFGSNYKKAIRIPATVSERLKSLPSESSPTDVERKKRKKHKMDKRILVDVDLDILAPPTSDRNSELKLESEPEVSIVKKKKKKKRKYSDDIDSNQRKLKKIKHNLESAEAWESEKAIEENLFIF